MTLPHHRAPSRIQLHADLIRQTSVSQLYWRVRQLVSNKVVAGPIATFSKPITDDRKLAGALRGRPDNLSSVANLLRAGKKNEALRLLAARFKNRQFDVYPLHERWLRDSSLVISEKFPHLARSTCREAEESLKHTFEFEGSGRINFGKKIDWNSGALRTCEQVYALNRFYHLPNLGRAYLLTGDSRYVAEFDDLIAQWLSVNEKPRGRPWNVLTTALRLNAWIEAYGCVRTSTELSDEAHGNMAKAVVSHAGFLAHHIEYDIVNNHLVFEGRTLLTAGSAFTEFRQARKWRALGMRLLDRELGHQVRPDGCHAEQSIAYHLQVMWEYLYAWTVLEGSGQEVPRRWRGVLSKMADFLLDVMRPDGTVPMIGDSASRDPQTPCAADVLAVASILLRRPELRCRRDEVSEKAVWLLGPRSTEAVLADDAEKKPRPSVCYPDGGYCVLRSDDQKVGCHAVFDCGPFGLEDSPGHGHADALSFEFSAFGKNLLIDPGVYTYEAGALRNFFRGTRAHNTVVVDGQDQAYLWGTFRVYRPRAAVLNRWKTGADVTFADAFYRWTKVGVTHRRRIGLVGGRFLLLYDSLAGDGEHDFLLSFHFPPSEVQWRSQHNTAVLGMSVQEDEGGKAFGVAIVFHKEEHDAVSVLCGSERPIQGWISYEKGKKEKAAVLELYRRCAVPTTFVTIVYPFLGMGASDDVGLRVTQGEDESLVTFVAEGKRYEVRIDEEDVRVESSTVA